MGGEGCGGNGKHQGEAVRRPDYYRVKSIGLHLRFLWSPEGGEVPGERSYCRGKVGFPPYTPLTTIHICKNFLVLRYTFKAPWVILIYKNRFSGELYHAYRLSSNEIPNKKLDRKEVCVTILIFQILKMKLIVGGNQNSEES